MADAEEGEFILNESGTAVSTDQVEGVDIPAKDKSESGGKKDDEQSSLTFEKKKEAE